MLRSPDELIAICLELEEISAQRKALEEREKIITAKCGLYLKETNLENVSLKNGRQVVRVDSIVGIGSNIPLEELAEEFKTTMLKHRFVNRLWEEGKLDDKLFSYEEKWSIKFKNL
ncbi:hypothetical protein [Pleurocapsa sp. FMAR1]|uniref:hypothetical protein n=1 Tax=Pleurocapsa sp. FMAR1 TaxID=3040204 RepID=UPI0029C83871|nr:hypothetical protein [Pleurocapsa sp. FMAR1]